MNSSSRRERPAQAGARSGSGANSVLQYIDQEEEEKPGEAGAQNDAARSDGHDDDRRTHSGDLLAADQSPRDVLAESPASNQSSASARVPNPR